MSTDSFDIAKRLEAVNHQILVAAQRVGRARSEISLLVVTKKKEAALIATVLQAMKAQGLPVLIGENYVQEYRDKAEKIGLDHSCHLIGALQRNKADQAVKLFDCIQSAHSIEVIAAISKAARKAGKLQRIYLQVNISADPSKSGFAVDELVLFLKSEFEKFQNLQLEGLMTITKDYDVAELARPDFRSMANLKSMLLNDPKCSRHFFKERCEISMGMSNDYCIAIEEGASVVRVGSAIVGSRAAN